MSRRIFKNLDWKYAIGEIVLIFIGITMAISFNNWNASRQQTKTEVKSLAEIKNAIKQDMIDVKENIEGFTNRVELYQRLLQHIENDQPFDDTLNQTIQNILGLTTFLSNSGPYETLKSRGVETISNDSIRAKISLYYDFDYELILSRERQHYAHYMEYLKPLAIEHLDFSNQLKPKNSAFLLNDFEFKQIISWALLTDRNMLIAYREMQTNGEELISVLGKEVDRLK